MSSRRVRFARSQFVIALLSSAWMTGFLLLDERVPLWLVWAAVPLCAGGMLVFRASALLGSALVIASCALCAFSGTFYGEIEMLLPTMYLLALQGRHLASWVIGMATLVILTGLTAFRAGAPWYAIPISLVVYGSAWVFGRIVRRRALAAASAVREASALASVDLEQVLGDWSLTDRRRATDESLAIVRTAVERMHGLAVAASEGGPPYAAADVDAIRREGERAIGRLHETLSLLDDARRGAAASAPGQGVAAGPLPAVPVGRAAAVGDEEADSTDRRSLLLRAVLTAAALALSLTVALVYGNGDPRLLVASIVLPLCAGLLRWAPAVAGIIAAAALALAAWEPAFPPSALLPLGLCLAVLTWELVLAQRVSTRIAMGALFAASLFLGSRFGYQGVGFVCVLVALAVVAAAEWLLRDEILHSELARAAGLTAGIAAARVRADRAERIQLARELHDGVSHGITGMILQVGAAQAVGDPDRARGSMAAAIGLGAQTMQEIDALGTRRDGDDLGRSIDTLVEGARVIGLTVEYQSDSAADALSYRIVQEALTNITRYAPGARVVIDVGERDGQRYVRIGDSGLAHRWDSPAASGAVLHTLGQGRGLRGLAARVAERDGRFRAGPAGPHDDGFEVYADWPRETDGAERGTAVAPWEVEQA